MDKSESVAKCLFKASIAFILAIVIFCYGIAVHKWNLPPYNTIQEIYTAAEDLMKFGEVVPKNRLVKIPDDSSREHFVIKNYESMMEGYYIFLGWDDLNKNYSARLYNHNGEHLHTWALDYKALDSDGPLNKSDGPHGFKVLRDGSIIVNFDDGDVLARVDSCGEPVWAKQGVYHHSLQEAEDGSFWTWLGDRTSRGHYHYLVNFDPETGATIKKIGLIEDLIQNMGAESAIFLIRPDYPFERFEKNPSSLEKDLLHPNDIDVLYSDLAPMFPEFEAGDLLISFLKINLVAVLDPDDLLIKWWSHGPWMWPHDPDFLHDGKISVYNNNKDLGRSEIIKIDPQTREISNDLFYGDVRFYSASMGKHQYLPNGNVLIVVPDEGRILVVSSTGQKIMEYNNISATVDYNGHVANGLWVPLDYFDKFPECS